MKQKEIQKIKEDILDKLEDFEIILDDVREINTSVSFKTYEVSAGNLNISVKREVEYSDEDGFIKDEIEIEEDEESKKLTDEQRDKIIDFIEEQE